MKVNYFAHYLSEVNGDRKYAFDLKKFIVNFDRCASNKFKKRLVTEFGEKLFLFYISDGVYLFAMTKDSELIKAIDESQLAQSDIYQKLSENESLGFASYLFPQRDFFGLGSTFYGPKITKLALFVNLVFKALGIRSIQFKIQPFTSSSNREEILTMPFVGRTMLEVGKNNSLYKTVKEFLGSDDIEDETDSIEIIIKPKRRKDLNDSISSILGKVEDEDLKKFIVRAKQDIGEAATDFYIVGSGSVADYVWADAEAHITAEMVRKCNANELLAQKINEFYQKNEVVEKNPIVDPVRSFETRGSWRVFFADG